MKYNSAKREESLSPGLPLEVSKEDGREASGCDDDADGIEEAMFMHIPLFPG